MQKYIHLTKKYVGILDESNNEKTPAFPVSVNTEKIIAVNNTQCGTCVYARGLGFKMHGFHYTTTVIPVMLYFLSKVFLVQANFAFENILRSEWLTALLAILICSSLYYNFTYRYNCLYVTETVEEVRQKIDEAIIRY